MIVYVILEWLKDLECDSDVTFSRVHSVVSSMEEAELLTSGDWQYIGANRYRKLTHVLSGLNDNYTK